MQSVLLLLPTGGLRQWHRALLSSLAREGVDTRAAWRPAPRRLASVAWLDALERTILARSRANSLERVAPGEWLRISSEPADLVFDLSGRANPELGSIFPTYNGGTGEDARDLMLLEDFAPRLGLARFEGDRLDTIADTVIAREVPTIFRCAVEAVCKRLTTLIRMTVKRGPMSASTIAERLVSIKTRSTPIAFLAASLAARARSKINRLLDREDVWRVAWRRVASESDLTYARLVWPDGGWTFLEDDRRRYFADPFLFEHQGVVHAFCEEYPYATGKAVISSFQLDSRGRAVGPPRVVLERPAHLSYPLVFRHGGQIWMMPESSGAGTLELYRADPFPDRWISDRILIDNLVVSDATFFEHDGQYWLTAGTSEDEGSSWDCLSMFVGPSPIGPWMRCGAGPVLVDASAARPAGRAFLRAGELWRPAQDCSAVYGGGIALCRVDHVDETAFRQTIMAQLGPPPGAGAVRAHTLNRAASYETTDVFGPRPE